MTYMHIANHSESLFLPDEMNVIFVCEIWREINLAKNLQMNVINLTYTHNKINIETVRSLHEIRNLNYLLFVSEKRGKKKIWCCEWCFRIHGVHETNRKQSRNFFYSVEKLVPKFWHIRIGKFLSPNWSCVCSFFLHSQSVRSSIATTIKSKNRISKIQWPNKGDDEQLICLSLAVHHRNDILLFGHLFINSSTKWGTFLC